MWLDILSGVLGTLCLVLGFLGCILPVLPGPPVAYIALVIRAIQTGGEPPLGIVPMSILACVAVGVSILDYIIPIAGARRYGATMWGVTGCVAGMILGLVFFPPFGIIIGGLIGAAAGELLRGETTKKAVRASFGTFVGTVAGVVVKIIACGIITLYFIHSFL